MRFFKILCLALVFTLFLTGCAPAVNGNLLPQTPTKPLPKNELPTSSNPQEGNQTLPLQNDNPDGQGVLHFTVMVHLEGWDDEGNEDGFRRHAQMLREYAALFEKYGAKLTLESKEFTAGCLQWSDNVLLELEQRGHGIGVHADIGGNKRTTQQEINVGILQMKQELESLGVSVRHISGVCSDKDWVAACLNAGFEATTGTVSYSLWSLDEQFRPDGFEPYENPGEGHSPYPWIDALSITPWYADSGADWIFPKDSGLLIIPSGIALTAAYENATESGNGAGTFVFDEKDIDIWRQKLDEVLMYTDSGVVNTYYAAYSFGSPMDIIVLEQWLALIDEYVQDGRIVWSTIPEMIDLYYAQ
ncbi:MAG: hypothetical protein HN948_05745 [Clostridia bacterium]|nr:hypothetical protein [Clostridia bacterium]MBT7122498.1 hypothetical protein [Clostridia bacterium]